MSAKTVFIIIVTALVTTVLVSNTGEMELWFFGVQKYSKLAVLGSMLAIGFISGIIVMSGSSKKVRVQKEETPENESEEDEGMPYLKKTSTLSDEDRDYIS